MGILSRIVPDGESAWQYTLEALKLFLDRAQAYPPEGRMELLPSRSLVHSVGAEIPGGVSETIGTYLEFARLLGQRTGELHVALADPEIMEFVPEPFSPFYLRSLYQSLRNRIKEAMEALRTSVLSEEPQILATRLLEREGDMIARLKCLYRPGPHGVLIRCHGSLQLPEVLYTGKDFFFIDFEGDAARPMSERRLKRPPAYDLAKMILSFHAAALTAVERRIGSGVVAAEKRRELQAWAEAWAHWVGVAFVAGYMSATAIREELKQSREDLDLLLNCHLLGAAAKEVVDDLRDAPGKAAVPMAAWMNALNGWGS